MILVRKLSLLLFQNFIKHWSIVVKAGLSTISTDFSAQRFLFFSVVTAENAASHAYVEANDKRISMAKSASNENSDLISSQKLLSGCF